MLISDGHTARSAMIERHMREAVPLPEDVTKSFVVFPLHDNPYELIK